MASEKTPATVTSIGPDAERAAKKGALAQAVINAQTSLRVAQEKTRAAKAAEKLARRALEDAERDFDRA